MATYTSLMTFKKTKLVALLFLLTAETVFAQQSHDILIKATVPFNFTNGRKTFSLVLNGENTSPLKEGQTKKYFIDLASNSEIKDKIEVSISWSQISDLKEISDSISYVPRSASYDMSEPVINLTDQKITWSFNNLPPQKTLRLGFMLTCAKSKLSQNHDFDITADISNNGKTIISSKLTDKIVPEINKSVPAFTIFPIKIISIKNNSFAVALSSNFPAKKQLSYGETLNAKLNIPGENSSFWIASATNLKPNTQYFFRPEFWNNKGQEMTGHETYSLKTSLAPSNVQLDLKSGILVANGMVARNSFLEKSELVFPATINSSIIIPVVGKSEEIKNAQFRICEEPATNNGQNDACVKYPAHVSESIITGGFLLPFQGRNRIEIETTDEHNNYESTFLTRLMVVPPLSVMQGNKKIEGVELKLRRFDDHLKIWRDYSYEKGETDVFLINGSYRAEVKRADFPKEIIEFSFDPKTDKKYPVLELKNHSNLSFAAFQGKITTLVKESGDSKTFMRFELLCGMVLTVIFGGIFAIKNALMENKLPPKFTIVFLKFIKFSSRPLPTAFKNWFLISFFIIQIFQIIILGALEERRVTALFIINLSLLIGLNWQSNWTKQN